jgi:MFS transporter, DHA2 family, multidrug resistance protein
MHAHHGPDDLLGGLHGVALGPIVGGLLLAHFPWGSVFLINVPIALLGVLTAIRLVPDSRNEHAAPLDLTGSAAERSVRPAT